MIYLSNSENQYHSILLFNHSTMLITQMYQIFQWMQLTNNNASKQVKGHQNLNPLESIKNYQILHCTINQVIIAKDHIFPILNAK